MREESDTNIPKHQRPLKGQHNEIASSKQNHIENFSASSQNDALRNKVLGYRNSYRKSAMQVLLELAMNEKTAGTIRLNAANSLLDRLEKNDRRRINYLEDSMKTLVSGSDLTQRIDKIKDEDLLILIENLQKEE